MVAGITAFQAVVTFCEGRDLALAKSQRVQRERAPGSLFPSGRNQKKHGFFLRPCPCRLLSKENFPEI